MGINISKFVFDYQNAGKTQEDRSAMQWSLCLDSRPINIKIITLNILMMTSDVLIINIKTSNDIILVCNLKVLGWSLIGYMTIDNKVRQ